MVNYHCLYFLKLRTVFFKKEFPVAALKINISVNIQLLKVNNKNTKTCHNDAVLVFLLITLNISYTLFYCFYC